MRRSEKPLEDAVAHPLRRREVLLATVGALGGCGGGVDSGGTGVGHQSTLSVGSITGFGSIVVNGVRFDESKAEIDDDEGIARTRADLRLGMIVEVVAAPIVVQGGVSTAVAASVRRRSELRGPIEAIDLVQGRLSVLGQAVEVTASTVVSGGLSSLLVGQVVEVYGMLDLALRRYVASRLEVMPAPATFKVRGPISSLDPAAATLQIGALRISWAAVAPPDPAQTLAPGRVVRATLARQAVAGTWSAVELGDMTAAALPDRAAVAIEGRISALQSPASFSVDGLPVEAGAADFPDGTARLLLGAKVKVVGRMQSGVVLASRVEVEGDDGTESFELQGLIESVDSAASRFVVRGITVLWTAATEFEGGAAGNLAIGRRVEVKGHLTADGSAVEASKVHLED